MREYFDCSEYTKDHLCYDETNKKVIGKFKDEVSNSIMNEFIGIRSKMYKYSCENGKNKGTAKGIKNR